MSSWTLKSGVDPSGITAELTAALDRAAGIFAFLGQPFTVTSLSEGQHVTNSKHYIGQAADLRTRDVDPAAIPGIVSDLRSTLGPGYTVINEGDHIHVQYNGIGTAPVETYEALPQPADAGGFDLSAIFGDSQDSGVMEAGVIDVGTLVALGIGALALWWIFSD